MTNKLSLRDALELAEQASTRSAAICQRSLTGYCSAAPALPRQSAVSSARNGKLPPCRPTIARSSGVFASSSARAQGLPGSETVIQRLEDRELVGEGLRRGHCILHAEAGLHAGRG